MTAANPLLSSINSGEFSPRMEARVDFDRYPNAAKMCRNFLLLPQGGITRRPGTRFVKEVKTSANDTIILPFEFSTEQAYIIEMGNAYARFYRRQARLAVDNITAAISNGTFGSDISGWTDPTNLMASAYVAGTTDTSASTIYTFPAHSIGPAAANRNVVVCISGEQETNDTARTISVVTIGGIDCEIVIQAGVASGTADHYQVAGIATLPVATGTTATIEVTFDNGMDNCRIDVFTVNGPAVEAFASTSDTTLSAGVLSATANVPLGGSVIAFAHADSTAGNITGMTWTGPTERSDVGVETNQRASSASLDVAAGNSALAVTATRAGGGATEQGILLIATFGSNSITHDATNFRLVLEGLSFGASHAQQTVAITETTTEHVLQFRIAGFGGGKVRFRVGTTSAGNELIDYDLDVGEHSIGFTPGAATIYIGFSQQNSPVRDMYIDNVAFIDNAPMELITPYATADLTDLRAFQAADVMFLLHPDYAPRKLERRGHRSWSIVEAFFEDGPYGEVNPGTDLDVTQKVTNPFFENGQQGWTPNTTGDGKVESEVGENRVKLSSPADEDARIRQSVSVEANVEHVVHFMVNGLRTDTEFISFRLGKTAGGASLYNNTDVAPRWTSAAFTPTTSTAHIQVGITDTECSPCYVHAVLIYGASAKLMRVSATSGEVTLTAVGHTPFASTDVGRLVRLEWPGYEPAYGVITAYTSTSVVTLLLLRDAPYAAVCTEKWQLGAWSDTDGWPQIVGFFEGRLVAANSAEQPQTLWLSQSEDLQNMRADSWVEGAQTVEDDDAIAITLNSRRIDPVVWLSEQRDLVVGTAGSQWIVSSAGEVVTPSDITAKAHSATPAAEIQAAQSNQVALFLDRSRRELYEIGFSFDDQAYITTLMTILADHIFRSPAHQIVQYQRLPHSILWTPREDGRCATLAYNRQHDILGWSQQIFGGAFSGNDAVVEHLAVIPGAEDSNQYNNSDDRDEVWLVVKRTVNGSTVRYIEVLEGVFQGVLREDYDTEQDWLEAQASAQEDAFYVDCGITYEGASTTTITGLTHLEGQTVKVLANGRVHTDETVASGQITLDSAATKVQVGLGYTSRYESLKLAVGATAGTAVNKVKAITGCGFVVLDSGAFKATSVAYDDYSGRRQHDLQDIEFRRDTMAFNATIPLATGEKSVSLETTYPPDARIYIESDLPLPLTVLALAPEMKGTDARATTA